MLVGGRDRRELIDLLLGSSAACAEMESEQASTVRHESSEELASLISELQKKHQVDLQNLTLTTQPFKTLQFFIFATLQYLRRSIVYIISKRDLLLLVIMPVLAFGLLLANNVYVLNEKHIQELTSYTRFSLWWVALGVASSIGLVFIRILYFYAIPTNFFLKKQGSGLHTFVLYLGPHIAFFTIKSTLCGRVDLKTAPYDTIQFRTSPSWLEKDCSAFGAPIYPSLPGSRVRIPISSVLPHVQLEALLWGLGTALGELPPYFLSRAARLSGNKVTAIEELDHSSSEDGFLSAYLNHFKRQLVSHFQFLNFCTILLLASVPNPLFDLAGIMCGQFGIPFWKFFLATIIGKAVIKTHIQTVFIISLCNNQLLEWAENKLILVFGLIPGFSSLLPKLIAKLHMVQEKYLSAPDSKPTLSEGMAKRWNLSFTLIWNSVLWLILINFFMKIVEATAQKYLKIQQDLELTSMESSPTFSK